VLGRSKPLAHVTITYQDGELTAYQDGERLHRGDQLHGSLATWTPGSLVIGGDSRGQAAWHGTIEALAVYHRCLDAGEVARNVHHYRLLARPGR